MLFKNIKIFKIKTVNGRFAKQFASLQQELDAIILEIKKIDSNNIPRNNQLELLKDLLHVLNVAAEILDKILFLQKTNN